MKYYLKPILLSCLSLACITAKAQSSAEKTVNQGLQTAGTLKQLFAKKKKVSNDSATATVAEKAAADNDIPKSDNLFIGSMDTQNAKIIDCDQLGPFDMGAAIIKKGQSTALIDSAGNFVVPFNKYKFIEYISTNIENGIFKVTNADNYRSYINSRGQIIFNEKGASVQIGWSCDGQDLVIASLDYTIKSKTLLVIDRNGKRHTAPESSFVGDGAAVFVTKGSKPVVGFKELDGPIIYEPTFDELSPFYDGIAVFRIKNQFGEYKYGAINKKGKIVIPATYPSLGEGVNRFSDIVKVTGTANTDYIDEFVNLKSGKILFKEDKQTTHDNGSLSINGDDYLNTSSKRPSNLMIDSAGNKIVVNDFLKNHGLPIGNGQKFNYCTCSWTERLPGSSWLYFRPILAHPDEDDPYSYLCLYNTRTGRAILGKFTLASTTLTFDPVTNLALVHYKTGKKDNDSHPVLLTGYMNTKGRLVMVKSADR